MNQRIKQLEKQCWSHRVNGTLIDGHLHFDVEKFAELIVRECGIALNPPVQNRNVISRGQAYDLIKKHFGVEE